MTPACFVENYAKASIFKKEGQPISPGIAIDLTFAQARDFPLAHPGLNERGDYVQAFSNDRRIDAESTIS
jgi:hypothetical protein